MKQLPEIRTAQQDAVYDPSVSMTDYHNSTALSRSGIVDLLRSPAHYHARHLAEGREERKATPAMAFGTMVHMAVLEPAKFAAAYAVGPDVKSKAAREWKDAVADNPTVELVKPADMARVRGIMESVFSHPAVATTALLDGRAEVSYFWGDDGRKYRVRPDMVTHDGMVVDLKTTGDASYETFMKHAWNMGYHIQAAFYLGGVELVHASLGLVPPTAFVQILAEVDEPFAVHVFAPDEALMAFGRRDVQKAIARLDECERTGRYPAYSDKIEILSPPGWAGV